MTIPEQIKPMLVKMRMAGATWTRLRNWLSEEYGIDVHRSTIQRWYDREGYSETDLIVDEAAATMADEFAPEHDNILNDPEFWVDEKVKQDRKVATYKSEAAYYKKLYQSSIKDSSKKELIIDAIRDNTKAFPDYAIWKGYKRKAEKSQTTPKPRGSKPQTMVAPLTDTHVGDRVVFDQTTGINAYDLDIFNKRLYGWVDQLILLAGYRRNIADVDELVIPMLGDMVSGDIHEELARTNIGNCMEQMMNGAFLIGQAITKLSLNFKKVRVVAVVGNHGRMTRKIPAKDKYMDWDHMMYQWVAAFCAKQKNIEFRIPKNFSTIFNVAGRNVLIMHGDSISGGGSSASFTRMIGQMRGLQQQNKEDNDVQHFDDVMIGHFHRIDEYDIGTGSLYVCGTMKGSDEFTTNRLHVSSAPKHMVTYWHPDHGNVSKEIIRLDKFDTSPGKFPSTIPEVWGSRTV
jgi:hypothetical protein|tara:strand:- start:1894 stop:3267 length:1374 start_codon:yes stop_codon:yes gene_type:complete